jgi:endonuclease/exonuclease/phosphatase family metal-dependent hydrolase
MDFFYDQGKKVRDTRERTLLNLDSITHFLKGNLNSEFLLLQEVDFDSKRTYGINEVSFLADAIKYPNAFGINYKVNFVPIPPREPMGKVFSGVLSFSKFNPIDSKRYAYPGHFSWPNRLFNLRRCMLVSRYPVDNGKELIIVNSHMSAFDDGSLKKQEMALLKDFVTSEYAKGNYVVAGGDWNQSPPGFLLNTFGEGHKVDFFILSNVDSTFLPSDWRFVYDPKSPTNRYLHEPYTPGKTFRSILDFFLVSPNIEVLSFQTKDLNFRWADHNPVMMSYKLKK